MKEEMIKEGKDDMKSKAWSEWYVAKSNIWGITEKKVKKKEGMKKRFEIWYEVCKERKGKEEMNSSGENKNWGIKKRINEKKKRKRKRVKDVLGEKNGRKIKEMKKSEIKKE